MNKTELGRKGEDLAAGFLKKRGYRILATNFRSRAGEIDIIARDGAVICFVEVKTRTSDDYGEALEAVPKTKRRKIARVALSYLNKRKLTDVETRFDIVAIHREQSRDNIELVQNAFGLDQIAPYSY